MQPTPSSLIAVDIGNSTIRAGKFSWTALPNTAEPLQVGQWQAQSLDGLLEWVGGAPADWVISSVNRPAAELLTKWHETHRKSDSFYLLQHWDVPLRIDLEKPDRVGMDRLVAAVAANKLRTSQQAMIIVDAGSAITVDALSAEGSFLGGAILPGVGIAAESLHHRTDQLPDVQQAAPVLGFIGGGSEPDGTATSSTSAIDLPPVVGKSTEAAIRSGLVWGTVGAVRYLIHKMSESFDQAPEVIFAGGDAHLLAPFINPEPRRFPDLVLRGIALTANHRRRVSVETGSESP